MRILTDTHALVWALSKPEALGHLSRQLLQENEVWASVANLWELILKRDKPHQLVADPLRWWEKYVIRQAVPILGIQVRHVVELARLPDLHKDPFDRILISQVRVEEMTLASKDGKMAAYGIPVVW